MDELNRRSEVAELRPPQPEGFKEIKPQQGTTFKDAEDYTKKEFDQLKKENSHVPEEKPDPPENSREPRDAQENKEHLEELTKDCLREVKKYSEFPDTIDENAFDASDLRKVPPEEVRELRTEFNKKKDRLIEEWEKANGRPWPTYKEDVVNENGIVIREAGTRYDGHHLLPLSLGGKNEVSNITPLHAEVHYDSRGVHSAGSAFDKLTKAVGGA